MLLAYFSADGALNNEISQQSLACVFSLETFHEIYQYFRSFCEKYLQLLHIAFTLHEKKQLSTVVGVDSCDD